jgi:hypothetical protein
MTRAVPLLPPDVPEDIRAAVLDNLELMWAVEDHGERVDESWADTLTRASAELGEISAADRDTARDLLVQAWRRGIEFGVPKTRVLYTEGGRPYVILAVTCVPRLI